MQAKKKNFTFHSEVTYTGILIRVHAHPERKEVASEMDMEDGTEKQTHRNRRPALRYAHERQHRHRAAAADPDSEEDNQEGGWKHHLTGVSRCVSDWKGKGHCTTQTWRRKTKQFNQNWCVNEWDTWCVFHQNRAGERPGVSQHY